MPFWLSILVWIALTPPAAAVTLLPRRLELALGPFLGRLVLAVDRKRSRIALANIRRCLPELDEDGARRLLRENYEHYGILALEILHLFSPLPGHYRRYALKNSGLVGYENWKKAADKGKGVIFASCHLGNWEMMAAAGGLAGMPVTIVTRRLKPAWLLEKAAASRLSTGVRAAYDPRTLPVVMKALRAGESVGFVIDQYAPPPMGLKARFFGVEVDTLAAVGPLAQRTGAAVVPAWTLRDRDGVVRLRIEPEITLPGDPAAATQALADKVESWVRAHPVQWLWIHRRFKNVSESPIPA